MEKRSVRLSSEEVIAEREIFEGYGINEGSYSDNYRTLLRFLTEHIRKNGATVPSVKHEKPNCKFLTEPLPSKYHCVHIRENAPPKVASVHLSDCAKCYVLRLQAQTSKPQVQPVQPAKAVGEIKAEILPSFSSNRSFNFVPSSAFTPNPAFGRIEVNYVDHFGRRVCPFEECHKWLVYPSVCGVCRKEHKEKHDACVKLCCGLREELNLKNAPSPIQTRKDGLE